MAIDPEHGLITQEALPSKSAPLRTSSDDEKTAPLVLTREPRGILDRLRDVEARLDARLGIEANAIDRKRPEDRRDVSWTSELTMAIFWASGAMNTSCFAIGFLGWEFGLSLRQAMLITSLGSVLGAAVAGFCATFGPAMGLRQMSVGRYSFGWWPNKAIAFLNCIQQVGWAAVSCITGGLALTAVSDGRVSLVLGVVLLAVVPLLVSFIGLKGVVAYERYAWIVFFTIFLIIFGEIGPYADGSTVHPVAGKTQTGALLNLFALVYGTSASWSAVSSDYYVHYRADVSRVKVFLMTTFGIAIPTMIGMLAGCVASSALNNQPSWRETYEKAGLGYLIQDMLHPRGFAKFLLTLLVFSGISTNVISIYSASLSLQQLGRPLALIPRFIWTFVSFACIMMLAVGGREKLDVYLQNFLGLLGYWCTSYGVILFQEHFIFRKGRFENYDLEGWNDPARLPLGLGAAAAFCLGVVCWCMGMNQTWFRGPLASIIGSEGGDVANQLTFAVTALAYVPARCLELKYVGR